MQVSKATARRATLHTGEAVAGRVGSGGERLKQKAQVSVGAEKQALSGDGPLCTWSEASGE